jgi:hypothetical protein
MSTDRSPESLVERQLREAMERGEFDDLPGAGQPIEAVEAYDPEWWARSFMRREQTRVRADDLRRRIRAEVPRLRASLDHEAAAREMAELNEQIDALNPDLAEDDRIERVSL